MMTQYEVDMVREAASFCRAVNEFGITHSNSLAQYARLRNIHEGKPVGGKWAKWAEEFDKAKGETTL